MFSSLSRRRLIGAAALGSAGVLITPGCRATGGDASDDDSGRSDRTSGASGSSGEGEAHPDLSLLRRLVADEQEIVAAYRATRRAFPKLDGRLDPMLADHQKHLKQLRAKLDAAAGPADAAGSDDAESGSTPDATPAPGATPTPPGRVPAAVAALRKRERAAAESLDTRLAEAHDGELARLIAAIATSETLHEDRLAEEDA